MITGASKGIGFAIAARFHSEGYKVIICARGEKGLEEAKRRLPGIAAYTCDLSDKQSVKAFARKVLDNHGTPDVLVNNGGVFVPGQMHSEADDVFESLIFTNLFSAYYLSKAFTPGMMERKAGTIVNMCSIASITAYAHGGAYSVSKFGLYGFSKSLREEMKPHGVRVVSILPGATLTDSWAGVDVPAERLMPAEDIAELVWTSVALSPRTVVEDIVVRPQLGDL
jgi:NAD(P)-dependent dehydrogenase (short-subunit alcohol dehydrogenase family)